MPPKRKNKATMAISAVPPKTTPRNKVSEAAKPGQVRRNSLAPSSGRTSRLLPSIPFQMTTRRGAKTASAASSATSGSRRSSINDASQYQDAPSEIDEDERPAKRSRTSTDSGSPQRSNGSFDTKTPMNGTQTPELQKPATAATLKRRRASDDSTHSSQTFSARANGLLTRTQSDVSEQQPRPKRRKTKEAQTEPADQPPELTDASSAPNSPEPIPDVDVAHALQNVLPTNGDAPAKPGRRLPGRRRQPHSDINIEVDLRRQLNLKMSYRSLAKVQKTLLEELSARTINGLENDPDFYKTSPHYKPVQAQLDQRRDDRMSQLHAVRNYRLEQLERVRVAEDHIQREQYINRFRELQDDFLLQCYFRAKQLEREMKGEAAEGTDDEDNVLPPTYSDEPHHDDGGRIGSKYASRSRAYVEAERELDDDARRKRFDRARNVFVEQDEDADDSIEESSGGFARFSGPARDEAIAHFNLNSIADAAVEVERTPSPQPEVPLKAEVMPNEQAFDLMRLADLSAQQPRYVLGQGQHPQPYEIQVPRPATPNASEATPQTFSLAPLRNDEPLGPPNQTPRNSVIETPKPATGPNRQTPQYPSSVREELSAPEPARSQPARISTHRIMDILNAEPEAPIYKPREQQITLPGISVKEDATTNAPRQDTDSSQRSVPLYSSHPPLSGMHRFGPPDIRRPAPEPVSEKKVEAAGGSAPEPPPVDQALMDALEKPSEAPSTPPQIWSRANVIPPLRESDDALRRRDPLHKIKEILDKKSRDHGRDSSDRPPPPETRPTFLPRISTATAAQEGYDPHRPSVGMYSVGPASASAYPSARRESLDHGLPHWNRDRRMSASQIPQPPPSQSPYQSNPPQLHQESSAGGGAHHSPYAPPAGSLPLPPKPPGMPSGPPPVNFRFAHYDPSPHRGSIPGRPPSPLYGQGPHPPGQSPMPYPLPYPPPPPYQGGYVPAPGSFQAPPPPPPQLAPYPPLKIHQYGGQPILPANMAPPPSAPSLPFIGQPPPHPPAFSPPQAQAPVPMYEPARDRPQKERPPEPQPRPRRQYRSYHAPGTQFRTYKGPREGRSSGGGSAGSGA